MNQDIKIDVFPVKYLSSIGTKAVNATITDSMSRVIGTLTIRFTIIPLKKGIVDSNITCFFNNETLRNCTSNFKQMQSFSLNV